MPQNKGINLRDKTERNSRHLYGGLNDFGQKNFDPTNGNLSEAKRIKIPSYQQAMKFQISQKLLLYLP